MVSPEEDPYTAQLRLLEEAGLTVELTGTVDYWDGNPVAASPPPSQPAPEATEAAPRERVRVEAVLGSRSIQLSSGGRSRSLLWAGEESGRQRLRSGLTLAQVAAVRRIGTVAVLAAPDNQFNRADVNRWLAEAGVPESLWSNAAVRLRQWWIHTLRIGGRQLIIAEELATGRANWQAQANEKLNIVVNLAPGAPSMHGPAG